ncbi:MAG TPA: hypothetical protein VHI52_07030, partial [Verrucomicrobiae bacterium]|nr:hypothetical protein [Verrucomicrobiae bacterium]
MNRRQRMLGGFLLLAILSAVSAWLALQWRYPYGRSHCCIKSMLLALNLYAQEHQGRFPAGQPSPEASLSLLYKAKLIDADVLRGKTAKEEEVRALLDRGELLGPKSCGWHYVEGLNQSDDGRLALLWDKAGLGHYGERHRRAWREVLLVDGDIK